MTDRSGCGFTELVVLQVVDELTRDSDEGVLSASALDEIDRRIGLGPSYAYAMMCDLVTPWVIPMPLLSMNGLPFDRIFTDPTEAIHTGCRLSRVGELALAAEARTIAPVPIGLINGTWWRGAAQPPLEPVKVIEGLRQLVGDPVLPDAELLRIIGRPVSLTGSELTGDFDELARGERTTIREAPRITITDGASRTGRQVHLIIDAVPRHLSAPSLSQEIDSQIYAEGYQPSVPDRFKLSADKVRESFAARALPIALLRDESKENDIRLTIRLRPGADPETVRAQLGRMKALVADRATQFPAPLADLFHSWITDYGQEDITASLDQLEAAIHADRFAAYQLDEEP